jgi:hypothetical protein
MVAAVLAKCPKMRGVLFDRPAVVERAKGNLVAAGVADRCAVAGDFFAAVPGADAAVLVAVDVVAARADQRRGGRPHVPADEQ